MTTVSALTGRVWVHQYYWDPRAGLRWGDGHALPHVGQKGF